MTNKKHNFRKITSRAPSTNSNNIIQASGVSNQFALEQLPAQAYETYEIQRFIINRQIAAYQLINNYFSSVRHLTRLHELNIPFSALMYALISFAGCPTSLDGMLNYQIATLSSIGREESHSFDFWLDESQSFDKRESILITDAIILYELFTLAFSIYHLLLQKNVTLSFQDSIIGFSENFILSDMKKSLAQYKNQSDKYLIKESSFIVDSLSMLSQLVLLPITVILASVFSNFLGLPSSPVEYWLIYGVSLTLACLSKLTAPFIYSAKSNSIKDTLFNHLKISNSIRIKKTQPLIENLIAFSTENAKNFNLKLNNISMEILKDSFLKHLAVSCELKNGVKGQPFYIKEKYYVDVFKKAIDKFFPLKSFFCTKSGILVFYEDGEKQLTSLNENTIQEAGKWLKEAFDKISTLQHTIPLFVKKINMMGHKLHSISFKVKGTEQYSIEAYASISINDTLHHEINVKADASSFPLFINTTKHSNFNDIKILPAEKEEEPQQQPKIKTHKKATYVTKELEENYNKKSLQQLEDNDTYMVSAGKYCFRVNNFSFFSNYEQGKISKALQKTATTVSPKTNMPKWLPADSLGVHGVKRLSVINDPKVEKGYSLKVNKYKLRLPGFENGKNEEGQTIIDFTHSNRFKH